MNALGGVEIDLPRAVDGSSEGYGVYPAGQQLLSGMQALNFARLFHPGGVHNQDVWGNLERQNLVVRGILAATLKPGNWIKIPDLVEAAHDAVITDLSPNRPSTWPAWWELWAITPGCWRLRRTWSPGTGWAV